MSTTGPSRAHESGALEALVDFGFTRYGTPRLIRILYGIGVVVIVLGALGFLLGGLFAGPGSPRAGEVVFLLVIIPVGALFYLIMLRIYAEIVTVIFRMAGGVEAIARSLGDGASPPGPGGGPGGAPPTAPGAGALTYPDPVGSRRSTACVAASTSSSSQAMGMPSAVSQWGTRSS